MKIEMTMEDLKKRIEREHLDQHLPMFIEKINFELAENMPWEEYLTVVAQMKKAELLYKTYILMCVKDDKEMRKDTMKTFKDMLEALPKVLIRYRKHIKECIKDRKKKKKECKAP